MDTRSILAGFLFLALIFLLPAFGGDVQADSSPPEGSDSTFDGWLKKAKEGKKGRFAGTHYYWDEGFHIVSRHENLKLKIGGKFIVDGGYIDADKELQRAFTDLKGEAAELRDLTVSVSGTIRALSAVKERSYDPYDALAFKLEIDFANIREIKDIWIQFPSIPLLGPARFGNMKEPFSLEELTSIAARTFMERALPTDAFKPGRNIGIRYDTALLDERITLGAGGFLNTGSFSSVGEAEDRISEHNGYDFTARVTILPWYVKDGQGFFIWAFRTSTEFAMIGMMTIAYSTEQGRNHALRMIGSSIRVTSLPTGLITSTLSWRLSLVPYPSRESIFIRSRMQVRLETPISGDSTCRAVIF